jgi:hypothetical protein
LLITGSLTVVVVAAAANTVLEQPHTFLLRAIAIFRCSNG